MGRAAVALIAILTWRGAADAAPADQIVLTSDDPELGRALEAAFDAGGIGVVVVPSETPAAAADTLATSRDLSARERASAVIWIVPATDGTSTILVFDREMDRVLVRPLGHAPPLDAEDAAEAASMVRTMLRAIRVTPDLDRLPPRAEDAASVRAAASVEPVPVVAIAAAIGRRRFAFELGSRASLGGPADAAWALSGRFGWYGSRAGVALSVAGGPAAAVESAPFVGEYGDLDAAVMARVPFALPRRATLEAAAGAALHLTSLDGVLMETGTRVDQRHLDPAVRLELAGVHQLTASVGIVLTVSVDGFLRRQRYLAGPDEVVSSPAIQGGAGLHLRFGVR